MLEDIWGSYDHETLHIVFGETNNNSWDSVNGTGWRTFISPPLTYYLSTSSQLGALYSGFGNGYVPYNIIIGPGYQVYLTGAGYDDMATRIAINDALSSTTLYPVNIPPDMEIDYNDQRIIDLSDVFYNESTSEVAFEVFENSDRLAITATIDGTNLIIDSHEIMTTIEITIKATIPRKESFIYFKIETFDPTLEEALFEGFEDGFVPAGWTLESEGAGWKQSSLEHEGSFSAYHADDDYSIAGTYDDPKEDWLWSSAIHINGSSILTFWQRSDYAGYRDLHGIAVSTDLISHTWLDGDLLATDTWEQISYDLSSYDGQDIYIGFYYRGDYSDIWFIDDARVWTTTGINDQPMIVNGNTLYQNYPNPFNPSTEIKFTLDNQAEVKLTVMNSKGEVVTQLVDKKLNKGIHKVNFNATKLNTGIYFYQLEVDGKSLTKKMLLLK